MVEILSVSACADIDDCSVVDSFVVVSCDDSPLDGLLTASGPVSDPEAPEVRSVVAIVSVIDCWRSVDGLLVNSAVSVAEAPEIVSETPRRLVGHLDVVDVISTSTSVAV